jgi:hypothetical protein
MTLRKGEETLILRTKFWIALRGRGFGRGFGLVVRQTT